MPACDALTTSSSLLLRVALLPLDQDAWREFANRYGPCILRWCCKWGAQDADAEDITQVVLTSLTQKLRDFRYDRTRSFRAFLRKVARDAFRDAMRKREREVAVGGSENNKALASHEARDELVSRIERTFDLELLERATENVQRRVDPNTWEAYQLTAHEGRSAREAAEVLGMRAGTVYQAKSNVLLMLREEVRKLEDDCDARNLN
jgi:RNA polymerase sigma factor (sigma-70 family)